MLAPAWFPSDHKEDELLGGREMDLKAARQRQKRLRDANRLAKRPGRDDVARVALFWLIRRAVEKNQLAELDKFQDKIVSLLVEQGFDERESDAVFDDLLKKYRSGGLPFRRKVHLLYPDAADEAE